MWENSSEHHKVPALFALTFQCVDRQTINKYKMACVGVRAVNRNQAGVRNGERLG